LIPNSTHVIKLSTNNIASKLYLTMWILFLKYLTKRI